MRMRTLVKFGCSGLTLALMLAIGCGGDEDAETAETAETTSGEEAPVAERDDGVAITGLMGTIDADEVRMTIEPKLTRFMRCFSQRWDEIEILGGHIHMSFRVDIEGNVLWVFPTESSIGDRETERCLLDTAKAIHFPRPRGGEAEFGYPLDLDTPEDVRPPVAWAESSVVDVVERNRDSVSECGTGFTVTAYVGPGGEVMAAGASTGELDNAENLDCVTDAVSQWEMPDPGSYPAKVSFSI